MIPYGNRKNFTQISNYIKKIFFEFLCFGEQSEKKIPTINLVGFFIIYYL